MCSLVMSSIFLGQKQMASTRSHPWIHFEASMGTLILLLGKGRALEMTCCFFLEKLVDVGVERLVSNRFRAPRPLFPRRASVMLDHVNLKTLAKLCFFGHSFKRFAASGDYLAFLSGFVSKS